MNLFDWKFSFLSRMIYMIRLLITQPTNISFYSICTSYDTFCGMEYITRIRFCHILKGTLISYSWGFFICHAIRTHSTSFHYGILNPFFTCSISCNAKCLSLFQSNPLNKLSMNDMTGEWNRGRYGNKWDGTATDHEEYMAVSVTTGDKKACKLSLHC